MVFIYSRVQVDGVTVEVDVADQVVLRSVERSRDT